MKVRNGFVSNSSSSSFVINLEDISAKQLKQIEDHKNSEMYQREYENSEFSQAWITFVDEEKGVVEVSTSMDNFDMEEYLKSIGVVMDLIKWGD